MISCASRISWREVAKCDKTPIGSLRHEILVRFVFLMGSGWIGELIIITLCAQSHSKDEQVRLHSFRDHRSHL